LRNNLQLVHAADKPDILDVSTLHVLDKAARLGVLPQAAAESPAPGGAALSRPHANPAALRHRAVQAGNRGRRSAAHHGAGGDAPDFSALEARVKETQTDVRRVFRDLLEGGN